ncbi:restriction endonuclease [Bacillus cereus]|uniref:restriction endonuclease n=1 Tax=Bacillus cereus TaxID=1396 RepID=UPI0020D23324|nr:restriction endonuclease [Bacillus cereus]
MKSNKMYKTKKRRKSESKLYRAIFIVITLVIGAITKSIEMTLIAIPIIAAALLLVSVLIQKKKEHALSKSGIKQIDRMDGIQFEYYLSTLFKNLGYKVQVTEATGDYGADLILQKGNEKIVVQAKRYSKNVGIKAVQEIIASKIHYKATTAWVVSNSFYTKSAKNLAQTTDVKLIDRTELIDMILKMNPNAIPNAQAILTNQSSNVMCPKCNSKMKLRKGQSGEFYGCSNYPKCKGTRKIYNYKQS